MKTMPSASAILRMQRLMHDEENRVRQYYNVAKFSFNKRVCVTAQKHAEWMARTGRYEHSGNFSEIIHRGPFTAKDAVRGWWNSPAHLKIMLSGTSAGHGHASLNNVHYWCSIIK
jgi:uncharacterized protein YkwD